LVELMCRAVTCKKCQKITWSGCGAHVESIRSGIPPENWCEGHPREPGTGFLARLFRRA
jgi:hypothetical protein